MPLIKSASKQAFKKNIKTEAKSKPIKQAVAIAFSVKRKSKGSDNFAKAKAIREKKKKERAFA